MFPLWVLLCVCFSMYRRMCVDGNALVCPSVQRVEDNFSCHSSDTIYFEFFETVSHWFGTCQVGWDSRSGSPQDLTVSVSPVLGPSIHHYSWLCYYYVCVCEFWSIELRSSQWRGKRFTNWAICPSWDFLSSSLCSILLAPGWASVLGIHPKWLSACRISPPSLHRWR